MEINRTISQILRCMHLDDPQALAAIIETGTFDVNQPINDTRQTILHRTLLTDKCFCFEYLLTVPGLQLDCQDRDGITPLIQATLYGSPYYVKRLLENGADSSLCNFSGDTPLHLTNSVEICQLLIDYRCDINALNYCGMSALHKVFEKEPYYEVCYMLLYHGIDARIIDDSGRTALLWAIRHKLDFDLMEILTLYTYDNIKEPIPLWIFIDLMTKKELRFVFDKILDSCFTVFYTDYRELKRFVKEFLRFDVEMLIKFFKRKPTILTNIFQDCVYYFRYSVPFLKLNTPDVWKNAIACVEFLENNSLFEYYDILDQKMEFTRSSDTLESLSTMIYLFLSRGFTLTCDFDHLLYEVECDAFHELIHFDHEFSLETTVEDLSECIDLISPLCLLILQPSLILTQFLPRFEPHHVNYGIDVLALFDYFASRALPDFCGQFFDNDKRVKERLVQMPTVPKLLQLTRDMIRHHIIKKIQCTKASIFYSHIKHLPISNVYKDILTYKTKIYHG